MVLDLQLDTSMIQLEHAKLTKSAETLSGKKHKKYHVLSIDFGYTMLYKNLKKIKKRIEKGIRAVQSWLINGYRSDPLSGRLRV